MGRREEQAGCFSDGGRAQGVRADWPRRGEAREALENRASDKASGAWVELEERQSKVR